MSEPTRPDGIEPPRDEETTARQRAGARRTALALLALVLIIAGIAFYYLWNLRAASPDAAAGPTNVLFLGLAERDAGEVDAVVAASFHPATKAVEAVVVPTATVLPWTAAEGESMRLDEAYGAGGEAALTAAVEELLGAPLHHTVRIDYSGFVELVELLEGVPVRVEEEIVYRDGQGVVVFHLEPGLHRLDGEEALRYVRYKGAEDEARRAARQSRFAEAVVAEARQRLGWDKAQSLLRIAFEHVSTNLDVTGATALLRTVFDAENTRYALRVLPGAPGDDGWVVDGAAAAALGEELFVDPSREAVVR